MIVSAPVAASGGRVCADEIRVPVRFVDTADYWT